MWRSLSITKTWLGTFLVLPAPPVQNARLRMNVCAVGCLLTNGAVTVPCLFSSLLALNVGVQTCSLFLFALTPLVRFTFSRQKSRPPRTTKLTFCCSFAQIPLFLLSNWKSFMLVTLVVIQKQLKKLILNVLDIVCLFVEMDWWEVKNVMMETMLMVRWILLDSELWASLAFQQSVLSSPKSRPYCGADGSFAFSSGSEIDFCFS